MKFLTVLIIFTCLVSSSFAAKGKKPSKKSKKKKSSDILKKIPKPKINPNLLPLEFEVVYNYVRKKLPRKRRYEFLKLTHDLNKNFQKVPRENLMFFVKAEVYRSLIQYEFDVYVQKINVSPSFLIKLEQKVQASKGLYDKFAIFLITALINDFDPYMNSPVFKNMSRVNSKNADDMKLAAEIRRKLSYLSKWFYIADKYDPDRFNKITYKIAWKVLYNLKSYMEVLGHFSGKLHLEDPVAYFELPPLMAPPKPEMAIADIVFDAPVDYSEVSQLEQIATAEVAKAKKLVQGLTPAIMQDPNSQYAPGQNQLGTPIFPPGQQPYGQAGMQPGMQPGMQEQVPYGQYQDPNMQGQAGMYQDPNMQGQPGMYQDPNMQGQAGIQQYDPYGQYQDPNMAAQPGMQGLDPMAGMQQGYPQQGYPQQGYPQQGAYPQDQYYPQQGAMPQQGDMPGQEQLPWMPDEYGDQLQNLDQPTDFVETPDGQKYKDGVYIVPNGGKQQSSSGDEEDDEDL
jgi:hypothetical protein